MNRWYWPVIAIALLAVIGISVRTAGPTTIVRSLRNVAFSPRSFEDGVKTSFMIPLPLRDVRRRLMQANLTQQIIEQQSGVVLYDNPARRALRGPLKDFQFLISRNMGIRVENQHYGRMNLDFTQDVWVERTNIKSAFTLSKPTDVLQEYDCNVLLKEVEGGTLVEYSLVIKIIEHAPESYIQYIQEQLHNAAVRSSENFQRAVMQACGTEQ